MASHEVFNGETIPPGKGGVQIIITDSLTPVFSTLWVCMRFYARRMRWIPIQVEDYMVLAALFLFYGEIICSFLMVFYGGFGHHPVQLQAFHIEKLLQLSFASQVLYATCLCLVKCSICVMLRRIFFVPAFKIAASVTMVFCAAWGIMVILIGLLICRPIKMNWDPATPGGSCGNQNVGYAAVGIVDLITDFIILLLPLPMVLNLHLPMANKVGLCSIFGAGILTMIAGGMRMGTIFTINFADFSYDGRITHMWAITEPCVAIMVASSPMLRPLFDRVFRIVLSSVHHSQPRVYYGDNTKNTQVLSLKQGNTFSRMDDEIALNQFSGHHRSVETAISPGAEGSLSESIEAERPIPHIHVQTTVTREYHAQ